jgi:hypothetical protein
MWKWKCKEWGVIMGSISTAKKPEVSCNKNEKTFELKPQIL